MSRSDLLTYQVGVLKHLFPTYMGRGARSRRKKFKVDHADVDKHAISLVATLCRELDGAGNYYTYFSLTVMTKYFTNLNVNILCSCCEWW